MLVCRDDDMPESDSRVARIDPGSGQKVEQPVLVIMCHDVTILVTLCNTHLSTTVTLTSRRQCAPISSKESSLSRMTSGL